jgi:adenylosuccinate lyase
MPNKVNPIDIENAKNAIEMEKRMINGICNILTETSYQRDVSDSRAIRNISSIMGYILVAINKVTNGKIGITLNDIHRVIDKLDIQKEYKDKLKKLTQEGYGGITRINGSIK